jgi:4-hydroxy-4-methyl-2-oxoglutarate aldolase
MTSMSQTEQDQAVPYIGHRPVIPPVINASVERVPEALLDRYRRSYVPDLSDAVGALYTMDAGVKPLYAGMPRVVGQALTVKAPPGDNLTIHGALTMVEPGDVLVVDWRGFVDGCATGASALVVPMQRGLRGVVADGAWRDVGELRAMGFPICARALTAFSPPKDWVGEINVPVSCGGVVVSPGDLVVGDDEGVVVVPQRWAAQVADALTDYEGPKPVGELDTVALERGYEQRRRYFEQAVAAQGGTTGR